MVSAKDAPRIDWETRDVMVGVLHNRSQLEICTRHRFYHIPQKLLPCPPENIRYIALYQSKQLFGENASGVQQYGKVERYRVVRRGEITEIPRCRNPEEPYCRFEIEGWLPLPRTIKAGGAAPGVSMVTNLRLLLAGRYVPELYIQSERHFRLYALLRNTAARTAKSGDSQRLPAKAGYTAMITGRDIGVFTPEGRYEQYNLREFLHNPHGFLKKMESVLDIPEHESGSR